jgi:hypothetical protein
LHNLLKNPFRSPQIINTPPMIEHMSVMNYPIGLQDLVIIMLMGA